LGADIITLRDIFYQNKDENGGQLFEAIDKMNTGGTYIFLFHESKKETVDNMLNNLDATFNVFGAWDDYDVHFRYFTALPIRVVGRVVKSTPTVLWANHLSAFKSNDIPAEIEHPRDPVQHQETHTMGMNIVHRYIKRKHSSKYSIIHDFQYIYTRTRCQ
jgi:hypothetical protein